MKALMTLLLFLSPLAASYGQQQVDSGIPALAEVVPDEVLKGLQTTLQEGREAGKQMPPPEDLLAAQEALLWISARPYILEETVEWPSPAITEARVWADCKGKSLWLADRLLRLGYTDVWIVVGKIPKLDMGHAWVELNFQGQAYILDGTYRGRLTIIPKDRSTIHGDHEVLYRISANGY